MAKSKGLEDLVESGYILRTHGYKGDMRIRLYDGIRFRRDRPEVFFLLVREEFIPYFISRLDTLSETEAFIHLEGLDNKEDARQLKGRALYVRAEELDEASLARNERNYRGYSVSDTEKGFIGKASEVLAFPQQEMLSVRYGSRDILIPLSPELIHEIDREHKKIVFNLPEGFLDL